jgi:rubredoxin
MAKYRCTICGYVYDEEAGDNRIGLKPGTKFSTLPNDWVCPDCGAEKSKFEEIKDDK